MPSSDPDLLRRVPLIYNDGIVIIPPREPRYAARNCGGNRCYDALAIGVDRGA